MTDRAPWPACTIEQAVARLTAPGMPFEMEEVTARGRRVRAYTRAVPTLRALLDESRRFGDRDFLVYEGERISFDAHWRAAHTFGRALVGRYGVLRGDRVAIAMRNFPEWSACAWGALAVGAVLVPLNAWETGETLARLLADCGAAVAIVDAERHARLDGHDHRARLIVARGEGDGADALDTILGPTGDWHALPGEAAPDPGLGPDDDATIFYTSGTTGAAKGALGTHRNIATNLVNIGFRAARAAVRRGEPPPALPADPAPRAQLLPLPLFHVTGFHSALVPALAGGATLVLMYRWDATKALALIAAERIATLTLVPTLAWQIAEAVEQDSGADVSSVQMVGYGGAAAAPALATTMRRVFPDAWPGQGYGGTETSSLVAANSHEDFLARPGSIGTAMPCCDLRIVDEKGADVPDGAPGELWVHGPQVVTGYWGLPQASDAAFGGGWYRTGDVVLRDEDGFLFVRDRIKDMVIRGGENIHCVEIEDVIAAHGAVAECAVFGLPERVLGEVVAASVVLRAGAAIAEEALLQHIAARLAAHKVPALIELRRTPLPRNATGKILKKQLKDEWLARTDGLAANGDHEGG